MRWLERCLNLNILSILDIPKNKKWSRCPLLHFKVFLWWCTKLIVKMCCIYGMSNTDLTRKLYVNFLRQIAISTTKKREKKLWERERESSDDIISIYGINCVMKRFLFCCFFIRHNNGQISHKTTTAAPTTTISKAATVMNEWHGI